MLYEKYALHFLMSSIAVNEVIRERAEATNQVLEYADNSRKAGIHTDVCVTAGTKSF